MKSSKSTSEPGRAQPVAASASVVCQVSSSSRDVVAVDLQRHEQIARPCGTGSRAPRVVPRAGDLVELKADEGRAVRRLTRERQVQERVAGVIDVTPGIKDVYLPGGERRRSAS